jgi:hypothetical protein
VADGFNAFDHLVSRFYDAAAVPSDWWRLVEDAAEHVGAFGALFLTWDQRKNAMGFTAHSGYDPEAERLYSAHFGAIDPRRIAIEASPIGEISLCHHSFDDAYVRRSEFYNDFLIPQGGRFCMAARLASDADISAVFAFHRNTRQGPFEADQVAYFQRLLPHAVRAARLSHGFAELQSADARLGNALEHVGRSVIVTDRRGVVLTANAPAEALLAGGDGLTTDGGRLSAERADDARRLAMIVRDTADARQAPDGHIGGALLIARRSGLRPLRVTIAPLSGDRAGLFGLERPIVILFVEDPDAPALAA